jgi:hypothetical protein
MFEENRYYIMVQLLVALLHREYANRPEEEKKEDEEEEDEDDEQPEDEDEDGEPKPKPVKSDVSPFFLAFSSGLLGLVKGVADIKINKGLADPSAMKMLIALTVGNHHLQELKLSRSSMNATSFLLLAKAIPWLTAVTAIDVSANKICINEKGKEDMEAFKVFTQACAVHPMIVSICLNHCKFGEEGAEMVADMLTMYRARLTQLHVKGNELCDDDKVVIGDALFASTVIFLELFTCDEYTIGTTTSQVKMIDKGEEMLQVQQ